MQYDTGTVQITTEQKALRKYKQLWRIINTKQTEKFTDV